MSNNSYPNIYHYLKGLGSKKQQIRLKLDLDLVNWKFDFKLSVIRYANSGKTSLISIAQS